MTQHWPDLTVSAPDRLAELRRALGDLGAVGMLCTSSANQTYLTGFRALLYSRPILLVVDSECVTLIVPGLEETHARRSAVADRIEPYYEHPAAEDATTPLDILDGIMGRFPSRGTVGIERSHCPELIAGHLQDLGHQLADMDETLTRMRQVKDDLEVGLIREAARIAEIAVASSLAAGRAGATEVELDAAGNIEALRRVAAIGAPVTVEQLVMTPSGVDRSVLPHAFSTTRRLECGDPLIHTRQVALDGYRAELERTAFVGNPNEDARRAFLVMREAQSAAMESVRSGVACSDVDRAARRIFEAAGVDRFAIHRTGHGIGLSPHESPYLRFDEPRALREGMVITIEPGIYVPGLGGFRHSDTVLVTASGYEPLTSFPSELPSLTLAGAEAAGSPGGQDDRI